MQAWYRTDEIGRPIAWFFGIQTFANIYSSLICYGVSYMNGIGGLSAWRWQVQEFGYLYREWLLIMLYV